MKVTEDQLSLNFISEKRCSKCKEHKSFNEFHSHKKTSDGKYSQCKSCRAIATRKDYENRKEAILKYGNAYRKTEAGKLTRKREHLKARENSPEKYKARYMVKNAIRDRKLKKRNSCELCHNSPTHGHHEDYSKPLDVIWLCPGCHQKLHNSYRNKKYTSV